MRDNGSNRDETNVCAINVCVHVYMFMSVGYESRLSVSIHSVLVYAQLF